MKSVNLKFKMWEDVFFFLQNSLEIKKGQIVGYFLVVENDKADDPTEQDIKYYYQVAYYNPQTDGVERMMLAPLEENEIFLDENEAKEKFKPWKEKNVKEMIENHQKSIEGANTNIKFQQEVLEGATSEIERLSKELEKE